jgi:hypothetical protein
MVLIRIHWVKVCTIPNKAFCIFIIYLTRFQKWWPLAQNVFCLFSKLGNVREKNFLFGLCQTQAALDLCSHRTTVWCGLVSVTAPSESPQWLHHLKQGSVNCGPLASSVPPLVFVNKVLWEHCCAYLLKYGLWLLSLYNIRDKLFW